MSKKANKTLELCDSLLAFIEEKSKEEKCLSPKMKEDMEDDAKSSSPQSFDDLCMQCSSMSSRQVKEGFETLKVDLHCHILPEVIPDFRSEFGYGGFITLKPCPDKTGFKQMWKDDTFFREIDDKCYSIEARLADMDLNNVQVQVISTVPVMFSYWAKPKDGLRVAQFLNDDIAKRVKQYPTRLAGLGTLPLQHIPMAVHELQRCILELGLVGVEIGSHVGKYNLDHERFFPLWKEAERLGACIFVHPWDMMGMADMGKYWLPWLVGMPAESSRAICSLMFGGVFKRFPKLRFCFAHGGGSFAHTIGRIQHGYDCRPDLIQINLHGPKESPFTWAGHFWVDSLVHNHDALDYLVKTVGEDRVLLGTDYPFPLGECYPLKNCGQLVETHKAYSKKDKKRILWYNGLDFIGKDEKEFLQEKTS